MMRKIVTLIATLALAAAITPIEARQIKWDQPEFTEEYVPGELLIGYKSKKAMQKRRLSTLQAAGAASIDRFDIVPVERVALGKGADLAAAARSLLQDPDVAYVEPNYIVRALPTTPNDTDYSNLWGMDRIEAPAVWDIGTGTTNIVVGVIDTGINLGHQDLAGNIASGHYDFFNDTDVMIDNNGHGTHVAGTIGAVGNNALGVAGVNWTVGLVALKFLDPFGSTADAIDAVEYAATNTALGIKITNNSWGGGGYSQALEDAIRMAGEVYGQLFIAAAGNDGTDNDVIPQYPANYDLPNVISVAALEEDGSLASFSCFGDNTVHIAAPGVNIYSTYSEGNNDNRYQALRGTSMASPHVAGAAALLWSLNPSWDYTVVRDAILNSAVPNPELEGKVITGGELNLRAALAEIKPSLTTERKAYRSDATVIVYLEEPEAVTNTTATFEARTEDASATVRWSATNLLDNVGPGAYTGSFSLTTGVTAVHGDTLVLAYTNAFASSVTLSLPIDDLPPVISGLAVESVILDEATITWRTDEPADTRVVLASEIPAGGLAALPVEGGGGYVELPVVIDDVTQYVHQITMTGLDPATRYYFAAISADYAGNESSSPLDLTSTNPADYLFFSMPIRRVVLLEDFDYVPFGWSATNLNGVACWEYGIPRYGPAAAYSGSRLWGTLLDANYPHLANAGLTGPAVSVDESPRLQFQSWHLFATGDFGMVEVHDGTGWRNVTAQSGAYGSKIEGSSGDWELITIDLPELTNKTIRVRFRIESDASGTAAGWFVDDLRISHTPRPGLRLVDYEIDDRIGGDGDGLPEPGEQFQLTLTAYNALGDVALSNVTATCTIADDLVSLTPASASVSYGNLAPGDQKDGSPALSVAIDASLPDGSTFTVNHGVSSPSYSGVLEDAIMITVAARETVSGTVTQILSGDALEGVIITGHADGYPAISAISAADGSYALHGLVPGVNYALIAGLPGVWSPSDPVEVVGPQAHIDFGVGVAQANPSPFFINLTVDEGQVVEELVTIDNTGGSIAYHYEANAIDPTSGKPPSRLALEPRSGTVEAGTNALLSLTFSSIGLAPGTYRANVILAGNDIGGEDVVIPVVFTVLASPVLSVQRVAIQGGDGDGFAEPGENVQLSIVLKNTGSQPAVDLAGGIASTDAGAPIGPADVNWSVIDVGSISAPDVLPSLTLSMAVPDGAVIPFSLNVTDSAFRVTSLSFAITTSVRRTISGTLTDAGTSAPLAGVPVEAESQLDGRIYHGISDVSGAYQIFGLIDGDYRVSALPTPPYAYPAAVMVSISGADEVVDFALGGSAMSISPALLDITLYEGQETNLSFSVNNASATPGQVVFEGQLTQGIPADEIGEFERPVIDWDALGPDDYVPGELLVRFEDGATSAQQLNALSVGGLSLVRSFSLVPGALALVPTGADLKATALLLEQNPAIRYVEPNYLQRPFNRPNDPALDDMYPVENLRQTGGTLGADMRGLAAWDITSGSSYVVVAVIDSGVKLDHEDLAANLVTGYDFGDDDPDPNPDVLLLKSEHGTHVAGTIGALGDNEVGIAGVAFGARIMPLKATTDVGGEARFPNSASISALDHAVSNGVKISNNSYGGTRFSGLAYEAIRAAMDADHLFVAAAGNDALNNDDYPAYPASYNLPNIISVAATDHNDQRASFSNFGEQSVDIAAPGVEILSTYFDELGDSYEKISGTSMAAPHVAGVAALLKSIAPDATYDMLKEAILRGARKDPILSGVVSSGGHLDAVKALELISAGWLEVGITRADLEPTSSRLVPVTLNRGGRLPTGAYSANILIHGATNTLTLPVNLTILPAAAPLLVEVVVDDTTGGDGDGYPEPGETIGLSIRLLNDGSALYLNPTGTLAAIDPAVSIGVATGVWSSLPSGEHGVNLEPFEVTLPALAGDYAFTLALPRANLEPAVLNFSLTAQPVSSITGMVTDALSSSALADAKVEYWGAAGGMVSTSADGSFAIRGLAPGNYQLRAIGANHEKSLPTAVMLSNGVAHAHFSLNRPVIALDTTQLVFRVQRNGNAESTLVITNTSGGDFRYAIAPQPRKRIGLLSDRDELNHLAPVLREAGWQVAVYSNNWLSTNVINVGIVYYGDHFADGSAVMPNDLVILDLAGNAGGGRLLTDQEFDILDEYLARGGSIIFSGRNNLSLPDDRLLSELVGSTSLNRATNSANAARLDVSLPAAVTNRVALQTNDVLATTELLYDLATPAAGTAQIYFAAGDAAKLLRRDTEQGGAVYLWSGNQAGADWADRGAWRDVLLGLIEADMGAAPGWLTLAGHLEGTLTGGSLTITTRVDAAGLELGLYPATLALHGNYPGADTLTLPVTLEVVQSVIEVASTSGVLNWMDQFVPGDGGDASPMYQVIYAGADGSNQPPALDGSATGDDIILLSFPLARNAGRFGAGFEGTPDLGTFRETFSHGLTSLDAARDIYIRAWDAATIASSVAYGDSALYTLQVRDGESHDFGTWMIDQAPGYPGPDARDSNGDSVPDGYYIERGLDPRKASGPLAATGTTAAIWSGFNRPAAVAVAGDLVFALDSGNRRVQVWSRTNHAHRFNFGSNGSANGQFSNPQGWGFDPAAARFAVADTGNHRVQVFNLDPVSGAITWAMTFGGLGSASNQLNNPSDVAIGPLGNFYVADTGNHRVQVFNTAGQATRIIGNFGTGNGQFNEPRGIAVDANGIIMVADSGNNRIQGFAGSGTYLWKVGGLATNAGPLQFSRPVGLQLGLDGRIFVADSQNHRIHVLTATRQFAGALGVFGFGDNGLNQPHDVAQDPVSGQLYIADTVNNRIHILDTITDADGDGLDDTWEILNGFNPALNNALADTDGDGVANIGEINAGLDPNNPDTDGDFIPDGEELANGTNPLDRDDPPYAPVVLNVRYAPGLSLFWNAFSGQVFKIETSTNLMVDAWGAVTNSVFTNHVYGLTGFTNQLNTHDKFRFFRPVLLP